MYNVRTGSRNPEDIEEKLGIFDNTNITTDYVNKRYHKKLKN